MQLYFVINATGGYVLGKALKSVTLRANTWFNEARISIWKSLFMTYCFVYQMSYSDTITDNNNF